LKHITRTSRNLTGAAKQEEELIAHGSGTAHGIFSASRSISVSNISLACGAAGARAGLAFFAQIQLESDYARFSDKLKTGGPFAGTA